MDIINREIENRLLCDFQNVTVSGRTFESGIVKTGKNYCSKASRFTIYFEKDGKKREKSFFIKVPYDIQYYEILKQFQFYAKEIYMYEVVLPLYKSVLPNESLTPEFYGTDGKEALILEDISKSGYQIVEGHKQMDFEHCAIALKLLAKFHALSIKIHETEPQILDTVRNESVLTSAFLQSEEYCAIIQNRLEKVVHRAAPTYAEEHPDVLQFLKTNSNLMKTVVRDLKHAENGSFNVINHGDFHTNNIMFAYDMFGQVSNAKCIDFQLCRWSSPALDIMYFSIVCIRPEVFEKYFHLLLEIYVTTLNATLKYLKSDQKLDMDILLKDIKNIRAYWLYTLLAVAPLIVSDLPNSCEDSMADEYLEDDNYIKLTKYWIPYFIKEGVFSKYEDTAIGIDQFTRKFQNENKTIISKYDLEYDVVKPGNNYCSGIIRVNFEYQKDENFVQSSVLLKIPSLSENSKMFDTLGIYHREVYMYENYLPKIFKLSDGEYFAPICHAVTKTQALVLEDLKAQGYRTCDRKEQLDIDHSRIALKTLAKYHALSVKYIQNSNYILDDTLTKFPDYSPSLKAFGQIMYDNFLNLAENLASKSTHKKLCEYKEKLEEIWLSVTTTNDDLSDFSVIAHGDFWVNNILFKYNNNGKVHEAKIIDWQMSRKALPVLDLIYFFATSVQFEVFTTHRDTLLNLYVDTLNKTLSLLQCNCIYTRADLDRSLEEYKVLFPQFVSCFLPFILTERDSSSFNPSPTEINTIFSGSYPSIVTKWLNYFVDSGIV